MILNKIQIDNYIFCPVLFAKNVVSEKNIDPNSNNKSSIVNMKKFITEIANYEMDNNIKLKLSEYRTKWTNKYFSGNKKIESALEAQVLISKLNNLFSTFSDMIFVSYNMPIDIPIAGTNIIYRDIVDYGMIDEDKNLWFVEFYDFDSKISIKDKINNWAHYYAVYSFLASSFNKSINVVFIDPDYSEKLEYTFKPERFENDYKNLIELLEPIGTSSYIYKRLFSCKECNLGC